MTHRDDILASIDPANGDDLVLPFQLVDLHLRGRVTRIGPVLDEILHKHAYPSAVAALLGETVVVAIILASTLKFDGRFTLQAKGEGPVSLLVADVTQHGDVRAYANYDEKRLNEATEKGLALLGKGYLAFTVDQMIKRGDNYQGIVELQGNSIAEATQLYFRRSEQIVTGLIAAVAETNGQWRGGAMLMQRVPEEGGLQTGSRTTAEDDDEWHRVMILMGTCGAAELCAPDLNAPALLYRLFNEDKVMVYAPRQLHHKCTCAGRIGQTLRLFDRKEVQEMADEKGVVTLTCQFCNASYHYAKEEWSALFAESSRSN